MWNIVMSIYILTIYRNLDATEVDSVDVEGVYNIEFLLETYFNSVF